MKVILQKPVDKLGDPGDIVEVADGYARNYLVPRGMAVKAEKGAVKHAESLRRSHEVRRAKQKGEYEAIASRLIAEGPVHVSARAGQGGKLFGSVTAEHIASALRVQLDVDVDRRDVRLSEPIRSIGTHEVTVHLFHEVDPVVTVEVEPEGGQVEDIPVSEPEAPVEEESTPEPEAAAEVPSAGPEADTDPAAAAAAEEDAVPAGDTPEDTAEPEPDASS